MENDIIKLTRNNDIEGVRKAIEKKVNVNIQDEYGCTALIIAIWWGRIEIAELLIEKGADVNIQNKYGDTALMIATISYEARIAKQLIEKGADVNFKNYRGETDLDGETALDIAKKRGNQEIVELLTNLKPIKVIAPTSKVIQINTNEKGGDLIQTALCEDGSVWIYVNKKWTCISDNSTN